MDLAQQELMEEWDAHYDYLQEAYGAEVRAIQAQEELEQWYVDLEDIFHKQGLEAPESLDDAYIQDVIMRPLHANHPLYVALEEYLFVK